MYLTRVAHGRNRAGTVNVDDLVFARVLPGYYILQKVLGTQQRLVISELETGCLYLLDDLGLVAANVEWFVA